MDFDWRFSDEAAELTLQTALGLTAAGDSMLFLGTPTVALRASKAAVSRDLRLVEWNAPVADVVQRSTDILVTHMDALRDASRDFSAEVVVTDPPWYRDYMHSFLWTASRWCRPNGHVLVSIPPIGTRPEMREEHAALHAFCHSVGLDRIDVMEGALPYITPPFEISALLASGFDYVPPVWRRGDLWVTRRSTTGSLEPPPTPSHDAWLDLSLGVVRVKVRRLDDDDEEIDPRVVSLIDGDVCPSVSRYHPLRQAAGLWTSNNRVFGCRSPRTLATIVQSLASNTDAADLVGRELGRPLSDLEARRVIRTAENLRQIAALERDELLSFRHAYGGARLAQSAS